MFANAPRLTKSAFSFANDSQYTVRNLADIVGGGKEMLPTMVAAYSCNTTKLGDYVLKVSSHPPIAAYSIVGGCFT